MRIKEMSKKKKQKETIADRYFELVQGIVGILLPFFIIYMMMTSCSVFKTAQDAVTTAVEYGKLQGRQEVIDELAKNKKKLNELKKIVGYTLIDLTLEEEKEIMQTMPLMMGLLQLLRNRQALKERLKDVEQTSSVYVND